MAQAQCGSGHGHAYGPGGPVYRGCNAGSFGDFSSGRVRPDLLEAGRGSRPEVVRWSVIVDSGGGFARNFAGGNDIAMTFTAFSGEWRRGKRLFLIRSCFRLRQKAFGHSFTVGGWTYWPDGVVEVGSA